MARNTKRDRRVAAATECCGQVCDDRCREASVRDTQFARRLYAVGMRVS